MEFYGPRAFESKISNFPEEAYRLTPETRLYKLLKSLLEDSGVGALQKAQAIAFMNSNIAGIKHQELDLIFGGAFKLDRLPTEMYSYDPRLIPLTSDQWDEVNRKDAQYRGRIKKFMQALMRGATNEGLAMIAEAASGAPCTILEVWRNSASLGLAGTTGRLNSAKEFIVVPKSNTLSPSQRRAIYIAVNRLKPANTVATVDENGLAYHTIVSIRKAISSSEYFEIRKYVTGVNVPPAPPGERFFWIKDGVEVEAPTYGDLTTMEERWALNKNITSVASFTISTDNTQSALLTDIQNESQSWGPWREIEKVDSPDNYPQGRYPSDPNKYDSAGNYVFAWASQEAYLIWLTDLVASMGGEITFNQYRLPISREVTPGHSYPPFASVAPVEIVPTPVVSPPPVIKDFPYYHRLNQLRSAPVEQRNISEANR